MLPTRSLPGVDPDLLLAAACLFAGLGLGITGLSLLAETGCLACRRPLTLTVTTVPTLTGAALTTTAGWLFGRRR